MVEFQEIKYEMNYHKSCKYIIYSCCFSCSIMSNSFTTHGHSPSGSSVRGISQAATREGLPLPSPISLVCVCPISLVCISCVGLSETPWTVARQAPLSMGFSRQEYWSRLPCPPPGTFPTQGSNSGLPHCKHTLYHLSFLGRVILFIPTNNILIGDH